jgi:ATPase subunit of ABC transporter with duplicated ATPase domains
MEWNNLELKYFTQEYRHQDDNRRFISMIKALKKKNVKKISPTKNHESSFIFENDNTEEKLEQLSGRRISLKDKNSMN